MPCVTPSAICTRSAAAAPSQEMHQCSNHHFGAHGRCQQAEGPKGPANAHVAFQPNHNAIWTPNDVSPEQTAGASRRWSLFVLISRCSGIIVRPGYPMIEAGWGPVNAHVTFQQDHGARWVPNDVSPEQVAGASRLGHRERRVERRGRGQRLQIPAAICRCLRRACRQCRQSSPPSTAIAMAMSRSAMSPLPCRMKMVQSFLEISGVQCVRSACMMLTDRQDTSLMILHAAQQNAHIPWKPRSFWDKAAPRRAPVQADWCKGW